MSSTMIFVALLFTILNLAVGWIYVPWALTALAILITAHIVFTDTSTWRYDEF